MQERRVQASLLERTRTIARAGQRIHELGDVGGIEGCQRSESAPPRDGVSEITRLLRPRGEGLQRARRRRLKSFTLSRAPLIELRSARQEESVEKRAAVRSDRTLEIAGLDRLLEVANVAGETFEVEPH